MLTATCLENSTLPSERSTDRHTPQINIVTTLVKDNEGILCRWKEHLTDLLNRDSYVEPDSIDNVPAVPVREELDDVIYGQGSQKLYNSSLKLWKNEVYCRRLYELNLSSMTSRLNISKVKRRWDNRIYIFRPLHIMANIYKDDTSRLF